MKVKIFVLIILLLLSAGSLAGYIYLTAEITAGNIKIAAGQQQLQEGEQMLAAGKAKLASGQQKMSQINGFFNGLKAIPLFMQTADTLPVSSQVMGLAKSKIAEGNNLVAQGKKKVQAGEQQLAEGKKQLAHGMERLEKANWIRIMCGAGIVVFIFTFIVLLYYWRRELFKKTRN